MCGPRDYNVFPKWLARSFGLDIPDLNITDMQPSSTQLQQVNERRGAEEICLGRPQLCNVKMKMSWIENGVAAVAEWYGYRTVACLVTSSSPVPLKTRRVGQRYTLNLSRAETSSRWCGVVVRRGVGASSGVVHVT
ncbi:uncharacterized protein TNCV_3827421 [Trichonephila clavipes]|nr:uncharacterized protein TNCV_3827421 [Trichonephila clavipes]